MRYDNSTLHPPGPMINVTIRPIGRTDPEHTLPGKLDTGSDITIIPPSLVDDLRLVPNNLIVMASYDGTEMERFTYLVDLEIVSYKLTGVEVVAAPRDNVLLGRDVLNHFRITLNGKELTFDIQDP